MRVKATIAILSVLSVILTSGFAFSPKASASEINMSQRILPVRFIYLNRNGGIEKVWSNVTDADSLYAIKFFDAKTQAEVSSNPKLVNDYQRVVSQSRLVSGTAFPDRTISDFSRNNLMVNFVQKDGVMEEVRTYS